MRRTTFLPTTVIAAAVSALFLTGCGSSGGGGTAADGKTTVPPTSASPSPSSSSASPSPSGSVTPPAPSTSPASPSTSATPTDCARTVTLTLTVADNGRTVCLVKGGDIWVNLDGSKDRPWSPVKVTGTAVLEARNSGFVLLPGDAGAVYEATGNGDARLTSFRPLCAGGPNRVPCTGLVRWTVTVLVRGDGLRPPSPVR